ncbi:MAG: hypothetical protein GXP48_07420 [Acidobacteria bacterium]|nr:hypothetical protein [Acidobacteriota bacterium]
MGLPQLTVEVPRTLGEALALLRERGEGTMPMAGGTDLVVQLKQGTKRPRTIVCLSKVAELAGVRETEDGSIAVGGGTTIAALESDTLLLERAPGVVDAARGMATVQVRNRATVAGNLATAAACADLPPILTALGGVVSVASSGGSRRVAVERFFTGARTTVLAPGELIIEVILPPRQAGSGSAYEKLGYRRGAQVAVASAAASLVLEDGIVRELKLVLGAVAPIPLVVRGASALVGHPPEGDTLEAACSAAARECHPISDIRGSEAYRRAVVAVASRRAILRAVRRAATGTSMGGRP